MKLLLALALAVSACSKPDSCEKVYDKTAAMIDGAGRPPESSIANLKDQVLAACHADVAKHPERQAQLDCILAIDGEVTQAKVAACSPKPPAH